MAASAPHLSVVRPTQEGESEANSPSSGGPAGTSGTPASDRVRQERIKLFATYLNTVAAGALVGALLTEPLAWFANHIEPTTRVVFEVLSIVASVSLHLIAQAVLGKLDR